ncbi:hypothetical protein [Tabrizicola sp.]
MKALLLAALLALSACSHSFGTKLGFGGYGDDSDSRLSGRIGGATVGIDP